MQKQGKVFVSSSIARYKPYGGYLTAPTATALDRGYTGHDRTAADDGLDLIYMNARYFDPSLGRFISADTLVPDPADPQAFNRYSYSLNSPLVFIDPSGHWACASDSNQADCELTIQAWLDMLANDGGDVARGLYLWFIQFDSDWIARNGIGVVFEFKNMTGAAVPPCGAGTGVCGLLRDPQVNIGLNFLNDVSRRAAALLGHEVVHLFQGDWRAWSIVGEAEAYYTQGMILAEFGEGQTENTKEILRLMQDGLTHSELYGYADYLRDSSRGYNFSRMYPDLETHWNTVDLAPVVSRASNYFTGVTRWDDLQKQYGME